jgi:hypothetical protein
MTEHWLPVVGFEKYYQVSDRGSVRSLPRSIVNRRGQQRHYKACVLRPGRIHYQNYLRVILQGGGVISTRLVHHLVLEAFTGPCPPGQETRHLNDRGDDNRLSNLAWGTRLDNRNDAIRNSAPPRRKGSKAAPNDAVKATIRRAHAEGVSQVRLAKQHGVNVHVVRDIVRNRPPTPYFLRSRVAG